MIPDQFVNGLCTPVNVLAELSATRRNNYAIVVEPKFRFSALNRVRKERVYLLKECFQCSSVFSPMLFDDATLKPGRDDVHPNVPDGSEERRHHSAKQTWQWTTQNDYAAFSLSPNAVLFELAWFLNARSHVDGSSSTSHKSRSSIITT